MGQQPPIGWLLCPVTTDHSLEIVWRSGKPALSGLRLEIGVGRRGLGRAAFEWYFRLTDVYGEVVRDILV